jgi:hypothetical protein
MATKKALCTRTSEFFAGLSSHMKSTFVGAGGKRLDPRCGFPVPEHNPAVVHVPIAGKEVAPVAGATAAAVRDVRLKPGFVPVEDPAKQFEKAMAAFQKGPFCRDDSDGVAECITLLDARMHDNSTAFIPDVFIIYGPCNDTRTFVMRDDLSSTVTDRQDLSRNLRATDELGLEFLKLLKAVARRRHFVQNEPLAVSCDRQGLSCEIVAIERFSMNKIKPVPGVILPQPRHWTSNEYSLWFGLFFATCPPHLIVSATTELVIALGEKYRAAHASSFWEQAVHAYKFAKLDSAVTTAAALGDCLTNSGSSGLKRKQDRDSGGADRGSGNPPKKKKYSKAERRAYAEAKKAAAVGKAPGVASAGSGSGAGPTGNNSQAASTSQTGSNNDSNAANAAPQNRHTFAPSVVAANGGKGGGRGNGGQPNNRAWTSGSVSSASTSRRIATPNSHSAEHARLRLRLLLRARRRLLSEQARAAVHQTEASSRFAFLPTYPKHWRLSATDTSTANDFRLIFASIEKQDDGPFIAGQLDRARIVATLQARAPGIAFDIPPIPLRLTDVRDGVDVVTEYGLPRRARLAGDEALADLLPEWEKIVASGAVTPAAHVEHWSPMFTVAQADKNRLIFDLRVFNETCTDSSFQMETIADFPSLAASASVACKLDLRSAFWQYPVGPDLSTRFGTSDPANTDSLYQWTVLPMGFSLSPLHFCSLTRAFTTAWRSAGVRVLGYVDDFIIVADNPQELARSVGIVVADLADAGIRVSAKKSYIAPFNRIDFLGLAADLTEQAFIITDERLSTISEQAAQLLTCGPSARRDVESFVGRVAFASVACPWLRYFRVAVVDDALSPPNVTAWSSEAIEELEWWRDEAPAFLSERTWDWKKLASTKLFASRTGERPLPEYYAATDASDTGIGMRFGEGPLASEPLPPWLPPTSSSTARELYGICRLVERFLVPPSSVIRLACDNRGAVSNAMGSSGCRSTAAVARRYFRVLIERDVVVEVEWIPREMLNDVDGASRWDAGDLSHSMIPVATRNAICRQAYGEGLKPDVLLFSSPHTRWADGATFGSRALEPGSVGDGVGTTAWESCHRGWAYPPFALVKPMLHRIASMRYPPRAVVVVPDTPYARMVLGRWEAIPVTTLLRPPDFTEPYTSHCPMAAFISPSLAE